MGRVLTPGIWLERGLLVHLREVLVEPGVGPAFVGS